MPRGVGIVTESLNEHSPSERITQPKEQQFSEPGPWGPQDGVGGGETPLVVIPRWHVTFTADTH